MSRKTFSTQFPCTLGLMLLAVLASFSARADDAVRAAYERAAVVQAATENHWLMNARVFSNWIGDTNHFWYMRDTLEGTEYRLVDAEAASNRALFRTDKLAKKLSAELDAEISAETLVLGGIRVADSLKTVEFTAYGKEWRYTISGNKLETLDSRPTGDNTLVIAPDGSKAAFVRNFNLWVRDLESGAETQLTTDGEEYYAYGMPPAASRNFAGASEITWSHDSSRLLTVQTDERQVADLGVMHFAPADGSVRPTFQKMPQSLPGDEHIVRFRLTSFDVASGRQVEARYLHLPAVRMNDTPIGGNRAWWDDDNRTVYFVDIERGEKAIHVVEFDTDTGHTRNVFSETTEQGYLELSTNVYTATPLVHLPERDQLVWFSERSGWAHLYLYDLKTGKLIRPLTQGEWRVNDVLGVNTERGELLFSLNERRPDVDPYYREIARVALDTGKMTILSGSDADHAVTSRGDFTAFTASFFSGVPVTDMLGLARTGDYYLETIKRVDRPGHSVLRDRDGNEIMVVEKADTSQMPEDFTWPEPVVLTAADGKTRISAAVFRPSNFDPQKSYAVVDYIYGGPQVSNVPESMQDMAGQIAQTIAELGFVVVVIDGRGTSDRSRAFHEASYGAAHTASNLEDHVAGIQQLAKRYGYMDIERVGINGFSGGGYATANAMLRFPEFFDVGVAGAGNHDQRLFWHTWGERYHGLMDGDNFLSQANLTYAENLQGKLLFIHGLVDFGVHPGGLFQLTQALMDANKDFDMVLMPRAGHEVPGYAMRRMWDYFIRHLNGDEPPADFVLKSSGDLSKERVMQRMSALSGASLQATDE